MCASSLLNLNENDLIAKLLRETHCGGLITHLEFLKSNKSLPGHWSSIKYMKTGETVLHIASRLGQLNTVTYLLTQYETFPNSNKNVDVDCKTNDDKTSLHEASQFSQAKIVAKLLEYGANVNALKRGDWTPLMLACTKNCPETVQILLDNRALIRCKNKDGWNCLHLAVRTGNCDIVAKLLDDSIINDLTNNNRTLLHICALHGHEKLLKMLLALYQLIKMIDFKDSCGNTPLFEAALSGNVDMCTFLISKGSNQFETNNLGFNILHLVASNELSDFRMICYVLNELKLDINCRNPNGLTPLHCAARKKLKLNYNHLLSNGADELLIDKFGRTPLDYLNY